MRQAGTSFWSLDGWSSNWLKAVSGHTKNGPFRLACNVWLRRILEGLLLRGFFATEHAYICTVLQLFCTCSCKHVWYYLTKMRHATQTHHGAKAACKARNLTYVTAQPYYTLLHGATYRWVSVILRLELHVIKRWQTTLWPKAEQACFA